jgi:uncharacterized coiled-coil protein SlyX
LSSEQTFSDHAQTILSEAKSLDERIFELEAKAADSEMIASLTTDEETKLYHRGLAKQLRRSVERLKAERLA